MSFERNIRPYFTACFRAHMVKFGGFDLWSATVVQGLWQDIHDRVADGSMPPPAGPRACPEGGWDQITRDQFVLDFTAWRDGGFKT